MSKPPERAADKQYREGLEKAVASQQRTVKGDVSVHGKIAVQVLPEIQKAETLVQKNREARESRRFLLEILTFIVLSIYAAFTWWQASTSDKQLVASQRPWIGTDLVDSPINVNADGTRIDWHIKWKNYGNSPALHAKWHTRLDINHAAPLNWRQIETEAEHLDLSQEMEFTIFNGQSLPNPGTNERPIPPDLLTGLANQTDQIILIGMVEYIDQFDVKHRTTFCIVYNPPRNGSIEGYVICPVKPLAD